MERNMLAEYTNGCMDSRANTVMKTSMVSEPAQCSGQGCGLQNQTA